MLYQFAKTLFLVFVRIWFRWDVRGMENIPARGPVVIVANHVSLWDPIILGIALPRKIHYMAKEELFNIPLLGNILPHLGAFPVRRGKSDRAALKAGLDLLGEGKMLGLFPEGSRSKTGAVEEFQGGAGLMAVKAGAPIVPVAVKGTYRLRISFKRSVSVSAGRPVSTVQFQEKKRVGSKELAGIMEQLRQEVSRLLEN